MRLWRRRKSKALTLRTGVPGHVRARHNAYRREMVAINTDFQRGGLADDSDTLTASGTLVRHGQATLLRRLVMPWQIRAFGYYDIVPELKYAAGFYSRGLANLELYAAEINDDGEVVETEDAEVIDALDRIKDPGGTGRKGLLSDYGRLKFLVGEALLFVSKDPKTDVEQWEMLSTDELRMLDGSYTRFAAPTLFAQVFRPAPDDAFEPVQDREAVAYRLWRRHPRYSQLPDSPVEGVLEILEELVLLTQAVRARARSRIANSGVLFLDDRVTTQPLEPAPDEDPEEDIFLADLTESMTLPIVDEGTASAVVPLVARVKVPENMKLADLVYHLQIIDPTQFYPEAGLRQECQRRLAIGLDFPPEEMEGLGDVNHWQAWAIDERSWKYHLQPQADELVADLTSAYLGPYLRDVKHRKDWQKFLIMYDAAKVINHPDRSKDFKEAHDRGLIGDQAYREAIGADEDDAPTKEELARIIGMATGDTSLAWFGIPSIRGGSLEVSPGQIVKGYAGEVIGQDGVVRVLPGANTGGNASRNISTEQARNVSTGAKQGGEVEKGPPNNGRQPSNVNAAMISGAAMMALVRAREAAGSKIRTACRRDSDLLAQIDGLPGHNVAPTLGTAKVRQLFQGARESELVAPATPLILDVLRQFGVTDETVRVAIAETLQRHAARTLYETQAGLPSTFESYVAGMLAASNGK